MFDHIGLKVSNLEASVKFYRSALAGLGHIVCAHEKTYAGLGPKDAPALWLYRSESASNAHIAFLAPTRAAVDAFHKAGLKAGGRDNGAPGIRADYSPTYYAAFLLDPEGNNVEAVCSNPENR